MQSKTTPKRSYSFSAIGTNWHLSVGAELSDDLIRQINILCEQFDRTYSRFRDDSLVATLKTPGAQVTLPAKGVEMLHLYKNLYRLSDGAVTPLIGATLSELGYDKDYSLRKRLKVVPPSLDVLKLDGDSLSSSEPVELDFGAIGKGALIDEISVLLRANGTTNFLVDGSGDLLHSGETAREIGLENPFQASEAIGTYTLENEAICGSATNRRSWGDGLHHVVDGRSGEPTVGIVATWVATKTATMADGLATALFFVEPVKLADSFTFEYARIHANGGIEYSNGFKKGIFA